MNIEGYDIARETTEDMLKATVKRMIQEGWEPIGGVSVNQVQGHHECNVNVVVHHMVYCQAMIKTKP